MATVTSEKLIVGSNIRRLCEERGVSLRKLSIDLKMNRSWLHDIVEGRANTTFDMLSGIAKYLGTNVHDLFTERKPRKSGNGSKRKEPTSARRQA